MARSVCDLVDQNKTLVHTKRGVHHCIAMFRVFVLVCTLGVFPCVHRNVAGNELLFTNDPSVKNPDRPPVKDDRAGVFTMTARQALKAIEEVHNGTVDCKTMLAERSLKLLFLKYENSVYTSQANLAIRTANLISDLLPTVSAKALNISGEPVLKAHEEVLYAIVRNNLENDPLIMGVGDHFR